jgi:hypothetical protein
MKSIIEFIVDLFTYDDSYTEEEKFYPYKWEPVELMELYHVTLEEQNDQIKEKLLLDRLTSLMYHEDIED